MSYDPNNPTTEGRYCPEMGKECPGTKKGCVFWRTQSVSIKGDDRLIENCLFVLQFEAQYQAVAEQIRTQATVQHFNNQIFATVVALQRGVAVPPLSGNSEKDKETIKKLQEGEV